jgi:hypothetical protein
VRFFDFPKGPSRGELHRHHVLGQASGAIVCYLFDDDLWLPDHVEVMQDLLRGADFAFSLPVVVAPGGELSARFADLASPIHRRLFTDPRSATASVPTCAAHTMALYRRLPFGWRTTPRGHAPDKYMWAQCLVDPDCLARSTPRPTALISLIRRVATGHRVNASPSFSSGAVALTIPPGRSSSIAMSTTSSSHPTGFQPSCGGATHLCCASRLAGVTSSLSGNGWSDGTKLDRVVASVAGHHGS